MATAKTTTKKKAAPKKSEPKVEMQELSAPIFTQTGKEAGMVQLTNAVFAAPWRPDLVHQVVTSMEANARPNVAHTKDRGEVRGGGKKPWQQKGTGRARHGSSRSPIWRGGGITFGPRAEKKYARAIPKRMRAAALASVLTKKFKDGEILFVDSLTLTGPKTKDAVGVLTALGKIDGYAALSTRRKNAALILLSEKSDAISKSFRNLPSIEVDETRNLNPVMALRSKYLVIEKPKDAVAFFTSRLTN